MSINLLLLCLLLSGSGGLAIGGALASLIGWFFLIVLLVLVWEYKVYIFIFLMTLILAVYILAKINEYLKKKEDAIKYKDETPEEKEERLKTEKMIEEWRKKF